MSECYSLGLIGGYKNHNVILLKTHTDVHVKLILSFKAESRQLK